MRIYAGNYKGKWKYANEPFPEAIGYAEVDNIEKAKNNVAEEASNKKVEVEWIIKQ